MNILQKNNYTLKSIVIKDLVIQFFAILHILLNTVLAL